MKSILEKNFKTNKDLEKTGITLEYFDPDEPDVKPVRILVARAGGNNEAFEKAMDRKTRPIRRQLAANAVPFHQIRKLTREVYAETVVLGWENVVLDGEVTPFSKDACIKLFEDFPDLFADIEQQTSMAQLFRGVDAEADSKN